MIVCKTGYSSGVKGEYGFSEKISFGRMRLDTEGMQVFCELAKDAGTSALHPGLAGFLRRK
jgi:hypothetical protein